jgi:hypothetical protein
MGPPVLLPIRRKVWCGFLSLLQKSIALAGFEHATFGFSDKHINHYTTNVTRNRRYCAGLVCPRGVRVRSNGKFLTYP